MKCEVGYIIYVIDFCLAEKYLDGILHMFFTMTADSNEETVCNSYFPSMPSEKPAKITYVPKAISGIYKSGAFISYIGGL